MTTNQPKIEAVLARIVLGLSLGVLALYSIKAVLSDCRFFTQVNCQSTLSEIKVLQKDIAILNKQISSMNNHTPPLGCNVNDATVESDGQSLKIDTTLWAQGNLEVLNGCWNLDWDYKMRELETNEVVGVKSWDVCFKSGKEIGEQNLLFEDGESCIEQPIKGEFEGGNDKTKLFLDDTKDLSCELGALVFHRRMKCELMKGADYAVCAVSTKQRDGSWSNFRPDAVRLSRNKN